MSPRKHVRQDRRPVPCPTEGCKKMMCHDSDMCKACYLEKQKKETWNARMNRREGNDVKPFFVERRVFKRFR